MMATPRVFISSTCYDLKYIRENLRFFVKTIGYEPILSEDGDVFYNPKQHTHDSCVSEIETCQLFVLIIGGRFGGKFKDSDNSITNKEYETAVENRIPIFALVESSVYSEYFVFQKNRNNPSIKYPSVDNTKIFDFIDNVRRNAINNALVSFRDFSDIEIYLKKQWAGMMYYYLTNESESKKVSDLLNEISNATQKIEYFTKNIAISNADEKTLVEIELYDKMIGNDMISTLSSSWGLKVTPKLILIHESLDKFCNNKINIIEEEENVIYGGSGCKLSRNAYNDKTRAYLNLRKQLLEILKKNKVDLNDYLKEK